MIDTVRLTQLHAETVERWHREPVDCRYTGLWEAICRQHGFNFLLWHEEDIARSPDVGDAKIAEVKRAIDRYNQQRNDAIEKVDDWITMDLEARGIRPREGARLATETPGQAIDRLSILALRLYHLEEQLGRTDVSQEHRDGVLRKIAICRLQQSDLTGALGELLTEIGEGTRRHRTYRQLKMYNDPALNPYLYDRKQAA
ncbi:MAG TPA: DUF4254 domain-containing protein [Pirellulaceae bacterium]|nr:DUF4254 domain-containing protein [Pirellulaceae bacterium]